MRNLFLHAAPCSDNDIDKWPNALNKRANARLTHFIERNDDGELFAKNLDALFNEEEIMTAIRRLKNGKALDNKRLPAEIIRKISFFYQNF